MRRCDLRLVLVPLVLWLAACGTTGATDTVDAPPPDPTVSVTRSGLGQGKVVSSPGGIDCGTDCTETLARGTTVNLLATADPGSRFEGWGGSCSGASTTCTVVVDGATAVVATFERLPVELVVTTTGNGSGMITSAPSGISCGSQCSAMFAYGTMVTLTATPAAAAAFRSWSGACNGTVGTCTVTMDAAKNVIATFRRECQAPPTIITNIGTQPVQVPPDCTAVDVKLWGGGGGGATSGASGAGGGFATAHVPATPGEMLSVQVADGGAVSAQMYGGAGGGGASAIARSGTPLVVAAGGGGAGSGNTGGAGGGLSGGMGLGGGATGGGGYPATQGGSGMGGLNAGPAGQGTPGSMTSGGNGGQNTSGQAGGGGLGGAGWATGGTGGLFNGVGGGGGGGGGGYYSGGGGGGGGTTSNTGGGGGGGASYVTHPANTNGSATAGSGITAGNNTDADYAPGTAIGGSPTSRGGSGRAVLVWRTE